MTFTKEQLIEHIKKQMKNREMHIASPATEQAFREYLELEIATNEIAIAALESRADAEPVAGTQFRAVADLYEMQFDDGHTVAFHTDPEKAVQWLNTCDGNKVQEYVKLERLQEVYTRPQPAPVVVPDDFDAWAKAVGLVYELYGLRSVNNATDIARKAWLASRAAMLQGKAEPVPGWIPCSERLPQVEGHYLVWANASKLEGYCNHQDIAAYQAGQWSNEFGWLVTHWMPLPAAPQQEAQEVKK
ncbi:DUF551 domain-containing protein [Atlantibacter hermannii]|uniref:DUF551 domain-containing protein n=1 Tax=Atlantibacter hermannii TaxID=565 RepID=UPI0028A91ABC|nr:DUF551 domain-containing protein [Atlantibacter hermannii]